MFERMSRGWEITKAAWSVLKLHPKLALLPVMSGLALAVILALIAGMAVNSPELLHSSQFARGSDESRAAIYPLLFAVYFVSFFVVIFFNAALIFCSLQCFAGHEPSLTKGLATAMGRPAANPDVGAGCEHGRASAAGATRFPERQARLPGRLARRHWGGWPGRRLPISLCPCWSSREPARSRRSSARRRFSGRPGAKRLAAKAAWASYPCCSSCWRYRRSALLASSGVPPIPVIAVAVLYGLTLGVVFSTLGTLFRTGVYIYATTGKLRPRSTPGCFRALLRRSRRCRGQGRSRFRPRRFSILSFRAADFSRSGQKSSPFRSLSRRREAAPGCRGDPEIGATFAAWIASGLRPQPSSQDFWPPGISMRSSPCPHFRQSSTVPMKFLWPPRHPCIAFIC